MLGKFQVGLQNCRFFGHCTEMFCGLVQMSDVLSPCSCCRDVVEDFPFVFNKLKLGPVVKWRKLGSLNYKHYLNNSISESRHTFNILNV